MAMSDAEINPLEDRRKCDGKINDIRLLVHENAVAIKSLVAGMGEHREIIQRIDTNIRGNGKEGLKPAVARLSLAESERTSAEKEAKQDRKKSIIWARGQIAAVVMLLLGIVLKELFKLF